MRQAANASRTVDILKWMLGSGILIAVLASFYVLDAAFPVRVAVLGVGFCAALAVVAMTQKGKAILVFFKEARQELRKIVWPSKQETMSATLMVGVMVVAMGLFLWLVDSVLLKIVAWLTGGL